MLLCKLKVCPKVGNWNLLTRFANGEIQFEVEKFIEKELEDLNSSPTTKEWYRKVEIEGMLEVDLNALLVLDCVCWHWALITKLKALNLKVKSKFRIRSPWSAPSILNPGHPFSPRLFHLFYLDSIAVRNILFPASVGNLFAPVNQLSGGLTGQQINFSSSNNSTKTQHIAPLFPPTVSQNVTDTAWWCLILTSGERVIWKTIQFHEMNFAEDQ